MKKEKTLLVIAPGKDSSLRDCVFNILVAETGEHLASHLCSNYMFAYGDLYANRPERIKEWTKKFGKIDVKYIDETEITKDELLRRNKNWYNNLQESVKS